MHGKHDYDETCAVYDGGTCAGHPETIVVFHPETIVVFSKRRQYL
jgi:hypothetical protein